MNRICLKRKEMNKQANLNQQQETPKKLPIVQNILLNQNSSDSIVPKTEKIIQEQKNHSKELVASQSKFQEFHKQYNQMRQLYEQKRKDYDEIAKEKKKLEILHMNNNSQYYEKQIKRLRQEVEKLQEENQDNKYKFIVAQNCKKQFEATAKVKTEDLKKCLQQLQKQKISNAELRHQVTEKQKTFQRITGEMEKSNQILSKNFQELNSKCKKLEGSLKTKSCEVENSVKNCEYLEKKVIEIERVLKKNKQIFDQTNFKKSQIIDELEGKLRLANKNSRDTIEGLEFKIQQMKNQRKTQNLLIDQRIQSATSFKMQRKNELQIVRLQQTNRQIKQDYEDKCKLIQSIQQKLKNSYSKEEYLEIQHLLKELQNQKNEIIQNYEKKLTKYQKQIEELKTTKVPNAFTGNQENKVGGNEFKEILKGQLEENSKMRAQLNKKIQQLFNCKSDNDELKSKLRSYEADISILNKKIKSLQKNHRIETDVCEQNLKNQIDSLKRKIEMLSNKLENKVRQVKQKENFIINTIIGRSKQEDVPLILSELQRIFETQYSSKLAVASARIQQLQKKIGSDK